MRIGLAMRMHICVGCDLIIRRDINTMISILNRRGTAGKIQYNRQITLS